MSKIHQSTRKIDKLRSCIIPAEWNLKFLSVRAQSGNCFGPITAILWMFFSENLICVRIQFSTFENTSMCIMHWNIWQIGKLMCYAMLAGPNMNILLIRALSCNLCWLTTILLCLFPEKKQIQYWYGVTVKTSLSGMHWDTSAAMNLRNYIRAVGQQVYIKISDPSELGQTIQVAVILAKSFTLLWPQ